MKTGSASALSFSRPVQRSPHVTAYALAESLTDPFTPECFSRFVTSTNVPIATGWNDPCRVGFAPTEAAHLCTAHFITADYESLLSGSRQFSLTVPTLRLWANNRLDHLAQSPYLRQTGLQPGDVILSINGQPVGDVERDRLELDNVLAQGSARIEVQRGDRRFFITASLK